MAWQAAAETPADGAMDDAAAEILRRSLELQAGTLSYDAQGPSPRAQCPGLADALRAHYEYFGRLPPAAADGIELGVPGPIAEGVACLLDALMKANLLRDEAFSGVDAESLLPYVGSDTRNPSHLLATVDQAKLFTAALGLADALHVAIPLLTDYGASSHGPVPPVDLPPVLFVDAQGHDNHHVLDYALIVELGGDDTYSNSAGGALVAAGGPLLPGPGVQGNRSQFQHVLPLPLDHEVVIGGPFEDADIILASSLVLDLAGDDTYGVKEPPNTDAKCTSEPIVNRVAIQGAGVASVAALVDLAGDNNLTAKTIAQGTGHVGGLGILYLGPGNDRLEAVRSAQGSGVFVGNGLLINAGGDDVYTAHSPLGGVFNGDRGFCDDLPRYTQGSGFGRSTGLATGVSGFLVDLEGDDLYEGVDKTQGHSEVIGVGVLADLTGDDQYVARNKSLAFATAHSDTGGAGLAVLFDRSGNDSYHLVGSRGLGYGNGELPDGVPTPTIPIQDWANELVNNEVRNLLRSAVAVFWEEAGTDTYEGNEISVGNDVVETHGFLGLFVDRE